MFSYLTARSCLVVMSAAALLCVSGLCTAGSTLDASDGNPEAAVSVDSEGNVGIGTLHPHAGLHVARSSHFPDSLSVSGVARDSDGEFTRLAGANSVVVEGNIAYVASMVDHSLTIVDVTDPSNPNQLSIVRDGQGLFQKLGGAWSVCNVGTTVYVVSANDDSLTIIDAAKTDSPQFVSCVYNGDGEFSKLDQPSSIVVKDGIAYVTSFASGALTIIDVTDPTNPELLSELSDGHDGFNFMLEPWNIAIEGNHAYVVASGDDSLNIIDVSNPSSPSLVAVVTDGVGEFSFLDRARGISVKNGIAFVAAQDDDAVSLIDVSTPDSPSLMSVIRDEVGGFTALDGAIETSVNGSFVAIASYWDDSLTLADITNPYEPVLVAAARDGQNGFYRLNGAIDPFNAGQYIYLASRDDNSLTIVDTGGSELSIRADGDLAVWGNISTLGSLTLSGAANPGNLPIVAGDDATNGNGAYLSAGGTWTNTSDATKKDSFQPVDSAAILNGVSQLSIQKWRYKGAATEGFHVGPTAQDFFEQFGLGSTDRAIATVDTDGVALLAIQELNRQLKERDAIMESQKATLDELKETNSELLRRLELLEERISTPSNASR